jgi:hypothetical protein
MANEPGIALFAKIIYWNFVASPEPPMVTQLTDARVTDARDHRLTP